MTYRCQFVRESRTSIRPGLVIDGVQVSGLHLWPMPMRIGSCEVFLGGIGGVHTHPDHRKRGYASIVMAESVAWMREQGYDVSVLFGIPDFYHRWGFVTTLSSTMIEVPTRHADKAKRTSRPRRFRKTDFPVAMRIYNRDNASRTASIIRRKSTWIPWRVGVEWRVPPEIHLYTAGGRTVGVAGFCLRADRVDCCEVSATDPRAFGGILRHAADLAVERRVETLVFRVPLDHPFADFCREQGGAFREQVPRVAGGMARLINQTQCLKKIAPELTRRLGGSRLSGWSGGIDIATDLETTRLTVKRAKVSVGGRGRARVRLQLPQDRLTQLLFGWQDVSFLVTHTPTKLTGDRDGVVDTLFPRGRPYMWTSDHF